MTEDERVGWHHRLDGHEFEQALGDSEGQERLVCCDSWGCQESDTIQQLKTNSLQGKVAVPQISALKPHEGPERH